jgi:hypothetical protein
MNRLILLGVLTVGVAPVLGADSSVKDEVTRAAKALAEKPNYSWRTTVEVPEGTPFRPGPTEGKTEKGGSTCVSLTFGDNTTQAVIQGEKSAVTDQEGNWRSTAELADAEGPGRFLGMMVRNLPTPVEQALELVDQAKELKKEGDAFSGELTEEGAKSLMRFRRRGADAGPGGPNVVFAKGSIKFWVKDGLLTKLETKVDGSMEFGGNEIEIKRTTTTEIKDVGSTKVEVPEGAKVKLS